MTKAELHKKWQAAYITIIIQNIITMVFLGTFVYTLYYVDIFKPEQTIVCLLFNIVWIIYSLFLTCFPIFDVVTSALILRYHNEENLP